MNDETLRAFLDELEGMEKDAFLGKALTTAGSWLKARPSAALSWVKSQPKQFVEAGKRLATPHKSIPAGWRHMTPEKQLAHMRASGASPAAIKEYTKGMGKHITERGILPKAYVESPHRIGRVAERLSRRGWTGKGDITKYIPLWSQKGMYAGFGGLGAKSVYDAAKRKPTATGEGGLAETGLGEALGTGAMIAGTGGLGILPASAMWLGSHMLGSKAGRIIDRLRGGAGLQTAAMAPSPQEAQRMLAGLETQSPEEQQKTVEVLQRYYG
jgi:hypothetical protein